MVKGLLELYSFKKNPVQNPLFRRHSAKLQGKSEAGLSR